MLRACIALLATILIPSLSSAASLSVETWRGHTVLKLSGAIVAGDSERFLRLAPTIPTMAHGLPVLLLESPGGSVGEAFKLSQLMETLRFHTVVPDGARCASACASIIFISGTYRTVEPFGLLGQHSCSLDGVADQKCNELLGQHAVTKGVSHGSIAAFVTYTAPEDILWFSREDADGWGLTRYAGERESGFQKSEPRVIRMITGTTPPAQSAWRLDFHHDGFKAFLRPGADHERELQLDLFCRESLPGRLFLAMEINGPKEIIADAALAVNISTDRFSWEDRNPVVRQVDERVTAVEVEIPSSRIIEFLNRVSFVSYRIAMKRPFETIGADTWLDNSRTVLRFAANNCAS